MTSAIVLEDPFKPSRPPCPTREVPRIAFRIIPDVEVGLAVAVGCLEVSWEVHALLARRPHHGGVVPSYVRGQELVVGRQIGTPRLCHQPLSRSARTALAVALYSGLLPKEVGHTDGTRTHLALGWTHLGSAR